MRDRRLELDVEAILKNLAKIADFLSASLAKFGIEDERCVFDVRGAVDEACTNIIRHAYGGEGKGRIRIHCSFSEEDGRLTVRVRDWGRAFDPEAVPEPDTESALRNRREGGLGMFLMKRAMDEVEYTFGKEGNELKMVKRIIRG